MSREYTYVQLKREQSVALRRNILKLEVDLLKITQKILAYKLLRKAENKYRTTLRRKLKESADEVKNFLDTLPTVSKRRATHKKTKSKAKSKSKPKRLKTIKRPPSLSPESRHKANIAKKLSELKKKLAALGEKV